MTEHVPSVLTSTDMGCTAASWLVRSTAALAATDRAVAGRPDSVQFQSGGTRSVTAIAAASAAPCAAAAPTWRVNNEITSAKNTTSTLKRRRIEIELSITQSQWGNYPIDSNAVPATCMAGCWR